MLDIYKSGEAISNQRFQWHAMATLLAANKARESKSSRG